MAESTTTPNTEGTDTQTQPADGSGKAAEAKTFTQEQVNEIVKERLARAKATPPADYEDLKAKAAKYDELEESKKSELERMTDGMEKAKADAADWKAKFEALEAEREHERSVRSAASTYGVDADVLMRMGGDVEDNAKLLKAKEDARPKFGNMADVGGQKPAGITEEEIDAIKDPTARIRARAEYLSSHNLV